MTIGPDDLLGRWALDRTIDDRFGGRTITVVGSLTLTGERDRIAWVEDGMMTVDGHTVPVRRELHVGPTGTGWRVDFADGRPFHPWSWGSDVVHDCAPDTYAGRLDGTPDRWMVRWDVTGPSKDHTIRSVLRPQDGAPAGR